MGLGLVLWERAQRPVTLLRMATLRRHRDSTSANIKKWEIFHRRATPRAVRQTSISMDGTKYWLQQGTAPLSFTAFILSTRQLA